jgi:hypothetical protein
MRVVQFLYDSERAGETGQRVARLVEERPEGVDVTDLGTADDRGDAQRAAMLSVGAATRIGGKPDAIFDEDGNPDFSAGAVVIEQETGRRDLYVGGDAVDALTEVE